MKIIDLSKYNTVTDWNKVKSVVDGVIIRCAYRGYGSGKIVQDSKFAEFARACKVQGIPFGVYFMSQAITEEEGREESDYAVSLANQFGATLSIFIDSEDGDGTAKVVRADGLSRAARTAVVKAFCQRAAELGHIGGVYASESWFNSKLNFSELTQYLIWVAKYGANTGSKCSAVALSKYDAHQYTSNGTVQGISGRVDVSEFYCLASDKQPTDQESSTGKEETEEYDMTTIKRGSRGKAVKVWQIIVGATPDGTFGGGTESKTKNWQASHGLTADGIVGPKSWKEGLESL